MGRDLHCSTSASSCEYHRLAPAVRVPQRSADHVRRSAKIAGIVWDAPLWSWAGLAMGVIGVVVFVLSQAEGGAGFLEALGRL